MAVAAKDRTATRTAAAKEQVAKSTEERTKLVAEATKMMEAKPTPTQEENDLDRLGAGPDRHADDGSGPEFKSTRTRHMEAQPSGGGYQTRAPRPTPTS